MSYFLTLQFNAWIAEYCSSKEAIVTYQDLVIVKDSASATTSEFHAATM